MTLTQSVDMNSVMVTYQHAQLLFEVLLLQVFSLSPASGLKTFSLLKDLVIPCIVFVHYNDRLNLLLQLG